MQLDVIYRATVSCVQDIIDIKHSYFVNDKLVVITNLYKEEIIQWYKDSPNAPKESSDEDIFKLYKALPAEKQVEHLQKMFNHLDLWCDIDVESIFSAIKVNPTHAVIANVNDEYNDALIGVDLMKIVPGSSEDLINFVSQWIGKYPFNPTDLLEKLV